MLLRFAIRAVLRRVVSKIPAKFGNVGPQIRDWVWGDVSVLLSSGAYDRTSGIYLMGGRCVVWMSEGPAIIIDNNEV